jgi:hypothetical protein
MGDGEKCGLRGRFRSGVESNFSILLEEDIDPEGWKSRINLGYLCSDLVLILS